MIKATIIQDKDWTQRYIGVKCCEYACNTAKYVIGIGSKKLEIAICATCLNALRKDIDRLFYPAIKPISKDNKDAMQ